MSASVTSTPPHPQNGSTTSPVEFVRGLSPEDKEDVFLLLLRELIDLNGGKGLIPIQTPDGKALGYYVPPEAARARWERMLADMPPAVREAMTKPLGDIDLDDCLTDEEVMAIMRREK
jgi:hypothetical protein